MQRSSLAHHLQLDLSWDDTGTADTVEILTAINESISTQLSNPQCQPNFYLCLGLLFVEFLPFHAFTSFNRCTVVVRAMPHATAQDRLNWSKPSSFQFPDFQCSDCLEVVICVQVKHHPGDIKWCGVQTAAMHTVLNTHRTGMFRRCFQLWCLNSKPIQWWLWEVEFKDQSRRESCEQRCSRHEYFCKAEFAKLNLHRWIHQKSVLEGRRSRLQHA